MLYSAVEKLYVIVDKMAKDGDERIVGEKHYVYRNDVWFTKQKEVEVPDPVIPQVSKPLTVTAPPWIRSARAPPALRG